MCKYLNILVILESTYARIETAIWSCILTGVTISHQVISLAKPLKLRHANNGEPIASCSVRAYYPTYLRTPGWINLQIFWACEIRSYGWAMCSNPDPDSEKRVRQRCRWRARTGLDRLQLDWFCFWTSISVAKSKAFFLLNQEVLFFFDSWQIWKRARGPLRNLVTRSLPMVICRFEHFASSIGMGC